jgi:fatty acid desaturase
MASIWGWVGMPPRRSRCDMNPKRKDKLRRKQRLARRHKLVIHGVLLLAILISLWAEGGKQADWLFAALAVITEVA